MSKRNRGLPLFLSGLVAVAVLGAVALSLLRAPAGQAEEPPPLLEYPAYPPTPTIGANPTRPPALAGAPDLAATFDDPAALADWTVVEFQQVLPDTRSRWSVVDGRLLQDATFAAGNPSIQETGLVTGALRDDVRVTVSFYDQNNGVVGLIARYAGAAGTEASYYRYRILKSSYEATPKQVLEKVVDGVATSLVEIKEPGFAERAWHTLELTVVGGQITVTLDGAVVAEATDPSPLPPGQVGLYSRAIGGLLFDDFTAGAP